MRNLQQVLQEHREEYIQYLKEIVAIDTHDLGHGIDGGLEEKGQEYMEALFRSMGASRVVRDQMAEDAISRCLREHQEGNPNHNYDRRFNVYATFSGGDGPSLMFNGHMDTMPAGNESAWRFPPHQPTVENGRLYGLGTADMKGGLMAGVLAVKLLQDAGISLSGDVMITSVCDEEGGGNGSMQAIMSGEKADAVIVCEATGDQAVAAHMGFVFFRVTVEGRSNHSGAKWKGVSAIEKTFKIIRELDEMEHRWLLTYKHPLLPAPNLNVGTIHGGTAGSTVAGSCNFETCIHYLPGVMSYSQIVAEFTDAIDRVCRSDLWLQEHRPTVLMYQAGGPFEMDVNHPLVSSLCRAYQTGRGKPLEVVGYPAGSDARLWRTVAGIPTLQFGPGNLEQCHAVNEYVEIESYLQSIRIYAELILDWCGKKHDL
ncbi:acetylornithine deacetylase [Oscillibacter valericigenes Sjm18-20]|nr:acetylornithine deacetylase [Oscillibacter valericigenes Sjm18-20]